MVDPTVFAATRLFRETDAIEQQGLDNLRGFERLEFHLSVDASRRCRGHGPFRAWKWAAIDPVLGLSQANSLSRVATELTMPYQNVTGGAAIVLSSLRYVIMPGVKLRASNRMLKKSPSGVLALLRGLNVPKRTPRLFAHCGLAGWPF